MSNYSEIKISNRIPKTKIYKELEKKVKNKEISKEQMVRELQRDYHIVKEGN